MPAQVRARVVERVDLGLEVAGGAVEDRAGREDARRAEERRRARARPPRRPRPCRCEGSWTVVTPKASDASLCQFCCGRIAVRAEGAVVVRVDEAGQDGLAGHVVRLRARRDRRPRPLRPTALMRLPSTSTTPSSMTSSPFIVTTRPPVKAIVLELGGMSTGSTKPMSMPCAGRLGQLLRRAREKRERLLQVALEELRPVGPVEPRRVAGEVQVLARVLRDARHRNGLALRPDVDAAPGLDERRDVGVEALAERRATCRRARSRTPSRGPRCSTRAARSRRA